jgi:hypothetical protein
VQQKLQKPKWFDVFHKDLMLGKELMMDQGVHS